jgi:hypothetical protein
MSLFLQIVGVVFLVILAIGAFVVLTVWLKIRRALKAIGLKDFQSFARGLGAGGEPARLELEPILGDVDWAQPEAMKALRDFLIGEGFESVGVFQTEGLGDIQLEGWAGPVRSLCAATYQHSALHRPWVDLIVRSEDGRSWTATNAPMGGEMEVPPNKVKHFDANATPAALLARLNEMVPPDAVRLKPPTTSSAFKERFEAVYAEEMEWRLSRGGPTEREVRAVMAQSGDADDEDLYRQTHRVLKNQAAEKLTGLLRERFERETTMSVADWREVEDRLVFVHEHDTPDRLNDLVETWAPPHDDEDEDGVDDEDEGQDGTGPFESEAADFQPRLAFARYNETLALDSRFVKIGELSKPVGADVYRAPLADEDDD